MNPQVRVGVSVILQTPQGYPMMLRKGSHGAGTWCFPGGHLEMNESVLACALRELEEELAVVPDHMQILPWFTEDRWGEHKHYITLYVLAFTHQMPQNQEPEKCEHIKLVPTDCEDLSVYLKGPTFGGCDQAWHNLLIWLEKQPS